MAVDFNEGFKIEFRNYVLNDNEIRALVEDRFIGAYLATFYHDGDTLPVATFYPQGGIMPNLSILSRFNLVINCYSNESYDECYKIDKALFEKLGGDGPIAIDGRIVIRPTSSPSEGYDEMARLFNVSRRYFVTYLHDSRA